MNNDINKVNKAIKQSITLLGSTGSIGINTLDVIARHPDRYKVFALTANKNIDVLEQQCIQWQPAFAVMADEHSADLLQQRLQKKGLAVTVLSGQSGLKTVASDVATDCVVAAIVGAAGLVPTLEAAAKGKRLLLANKEALVMSGQLFMDTVQENQAQLLPVDSEHNAIFQCLPDSCDNQLLKKHDKGVNKLLLTASGGPFRTCSLNDLHSVTPAQAVAHPNWDMGKKISVDSATMMNKGLELIEAHWLFGIDVENIDIVIHPQSIIHSMVSYNDGSVLAQLGNPDMRTPIACALAWPERIESGVEPLDIFAVAKLDFERPDLNRFPCLGLCYEAIKTGGSASIVLNAANEVAVDAFLNGRIAFTAIASVVEETLSRASISTDIGALPLILNADKAARTIAQASVSNRETIIH